MRTNRFVLLSLLLVGLSACSSKSEPAPNVTPSPSRAPTANSAAGSTPTNDLTGVYVYKTVRYHNEFVVQQLSANQIKVQFGGTTEYKTAAGDLIADAGGTVPQVVALDVETQSTGVLVPEDAADDCRIVLQFAGVKLKVEQEGGCGFGAKVSAAGDYTRRSGVPVKFKTADEAASDQPPPPRDERIQFARGQSSATVTGNIRDGQEVVYLIDARAGQTFAAKVTSTAANDDVVFHLVGPGGVEPMSDPKDEAGGYDGEWQGRLPRTGTYRIVVGAIESKQIAFKLTVAIR